MRERERQRKRASKQARERERTREKERARKCEGEIETERKRERETVRETERGWPLLTQPQPNILKRHLSVILDSKYGSELAFENSYLIVCQLLISKFDRGAVSRVPVYI